MKKFMTILAVLMCLSISLTAYAQSEPEADPAAQSNPNATTGIGENVDDPLPIQEVDPEADPAAQSNPNVSTASLYDDPDWYKAFGYETDPRIDNPDWNPEDAKKDMNVDDAIGLDVGRSGGGDKSGFDLWIWVVGGIALLATTAVFFANRTRFMPAMQTANGNVVTANAPVSRKQTIDAIKNSALTPSGDVFKSIMEKVDTAKRNTAK